MKTLAPLFALLLGVALIAGAQQRPITGGRTSVLTATPILASSLGNPSLTEVERAWRQAAPLNLRLSGSLAIAVQVRAAYSRQAIYFWLRWPDDLRSSSSADVQQQRSTMTWRRATEMGGCAVVCHTSFSTGAWIDNIQTVAPDIDGHAFTILLDQWRDGWWTLGYSRPLLTGSPVDIQFNDLTGSYPFGLDIAAGNGSAHTSGEDLTLRFGGTGAAG